MIRDYYRPEATVKPSEKNKTKLSAHERFRYIDVFGTI